jgi:hypothetical protein
MMQIQYVYFFQMLFLILNRDRMLIHAFKNSKSGYIFAHQKLSSLFATTTAPPVAKQSVTDQMGAVGIASGN